MNAQVSAEGNKGFKANLVNEILELNRSIGRHGKRIEQENRRTGGYAGEEQIFERLPRCARNDK